MSNVMVTTPDESVIITADAPDLIGITSKRSNVIIDPGGMPGPPGPPGPSGTMVVPVAYTDWPPTNPQPNTLYLRLAP